MKKRLIGMVLVLTMLLGTSIQSIAAESADSKDVKGEGSGIASILTTNEISSLDGEQTAQPRYPGNASIISAKVYAADSTTMQYYTDYYTSMKPQSRQWCNGTLGANTAALYRNNNCDSFYVQVTVDKSTASYYEAFDNNVSLGGGYIGGGAPNTYTVFSLLIKNNNPGNWEIVLSDLGENRGMPLWGYIYMPE